MKILTQNKKKLSVSIKIVKDTFQGFIDDNVMRLSASLAYATLFSIIPLLSLLVTIGVLLNVDFTNQLYAQLEPIVGSKVIDALQAIMENAESLSHEADTEGITGFMYGCAVSILSSSWEYGEELRKWHNKEYDYEGDGVVNPAIITLQKREE